MNSDLFNNNSNYINSLKILLLQLKHAIRIKFKSYINF
jgi:hypothetical protein